ncbi:hypothetical protein [Streptomyces sp. NPDC058964]|uniref:hypothetical protein n=1 Tax=Streptomyces sp. NPDC058964 TaxID=3346681 RepID=UPI0036B3ED5A
MNGVSTPLTGALAADFDWACARHVVDLGGALGAVPAAVLRSHPEITGAVFELPPAPGRDEPDIGDARRRTASPAPSAPVRSTTTGHRLFVRGRAVWPMAGAWTGPGRARTRIRRTARPRVRQPATRRLRRRQSRCPPRALRRRSVPPRSR